ncbi:MAG TPA: Fic family protein [Candidatus Wallbacteria bacterium]|nr:Fic family protein [Candidatus Wallbacteria bacterium]
MKSLENNFLEKIIIPHRLISLIRLIGEFKGKQELYEQQSPKILESLKKVAIIQSTESSNRLEGITADIKRIQELVEEKTKPQNRSESEIAGYRDVLNTIHSNYGHVHLKPGIILQLHRDLMKYTERYGGKWKFGDNEISELLPDGKKKVRFKPVAAFQTNEYMIMLQDLFNEHIKTQTIDPLILIPLYILDFLCIHPFDDGNGRMARLLTVLLLYQNGYEVGRFISLEKVIEKTDKSYYDTLYKSSIGWHESKHDPLSWVEYFLGIVLAAYREFESRVGKISSGYGAKTEMVLIAIKNFMTDFSLSDIERACPAVGRDMIRKILFKLRDEGKIESLGKGRYAKWRKIT